MACSHPQCIGSSDFERVIFYARRRYIDGVDTITLMSEACSERERREVALAALLHLDDADLSGLKLCRCETGCTDPGFLARLKALLAQDISFAAIA